jgi:hypothetical protein
MGEIKTKLVEAAIGEWNYFGKSTRKGDEWSLIGDEQVEPYTSHISNYWRAVGLPDWNGRTPQPWSAAFISWCFEEAGAAGKFSPSATHSVYIDRIRRHDGMSRDLILKSPTDAQISVGDLIWNPRPPSNPAARLPRDYSEAITMLEAGNFFDSHVDIVVSVNAASCDSIGGNVSNLPVGGSVTRSTWRLEEGLLVDVHKTWVGVVKNGL